MKFKVRKANKNDIDSIVELNKKLIDYHRRKDKYYKYTSETRKIFRDYLSKIMKKKNVRIIVAEVNGEIIGYFVGSIGKAKPFTSFKKIGRISDAFVEEKFRKSGIGKSMFDELLSWFKKNKVKYVELFVDSKNQAGIKAWRKFGFREFMKRMGLEL